MPIRVLQVFGIMNRGGAETMIMNLYRNIDRNKVQFDFVVHHNVQGDYDEEIKSLGGRIYYVQDYKIINHLSYVSSWKKLLKEHPEWKVVHGHMYSIASIYLKVAKNEGRYTIAHSHSTSNGKGVQSIIKKIYEIPLKYVADFYFACSKSAGEWLFGKKIIESDKYITLPNAIDVEKFVYNEQTRNETRKKLNIEEKIIIGHVGRYDYSKNFPFLLDLIEELSKINSNYLLLQVGNAKSNTNLQKNVADRNLQDNIKFLGVRNDVSDLMQAMDVFVLPSIYEGLGIVAIESQAAGLPSFVSDNLPDELLITNLIKKLPIDQGINPWIHEILNKDKLIRVNTSQEITSRGYNIKNTTNDLVKYYFDILNVHR